VLVRKANGGKSDALNAGINVARYPLVAMVDADSLLDPDALLVVAKPFADDPLRTLPNTLLTPHLGFVTEPVFARFAHGVAEGLLAWLRGEKPPRMRG
jgi:cellulose synthase/poly-beta-1,6-N-acetylglucosamine synthase-like glycosyltransferase